MKNMKIIIKTAFLALSLIILSITSCKKKESTPAPITNPTPTPVNNRVIKFQISGNYTGSLTVAYTNASGGTESKIATAFPWIKDITYPATVSGIGIGGNTSVAGAPSQTLTLQIYSAGNVVSTGTAVTDGNGLINLPTLAYVF